MTTDQPAGPDISAAVSDREGSAVIEVWVVPGASRTEAVGLHGDALRVRLAAPAEGGKANRALVNLLEKITGREAEIIGGKGSRRKQLLVRGATAVDVARLISLHIV